MKISCIIVEDEPASQDILKQYVARVARLELLRVCSHALEATEVLSRQEVQLMFLDINMPGISGIGFYKALTNPPHVIFTTAYSEYALEGFEVNAIDYLLKPFPFERFLKAVNKFQPDSTQDASGDYILLRADKKTCKIGLREILIIEAMGDYVKVHLPGKMIIVHETLQGIQLRLPAALFARVHKSYIISLERFEYLEGNMLRVASVSIPLGQTYKNSFLDLIQRR
ncbi:MAG TPA: response regulator transcription factor [Anseongella sp.]|nr:response regulator transcription factor [Anseongella sp.]